MDTIEQIRVARASGDRLEFRCLEDRESDSLAGNATISRILTSVCFGFKSQFCHLG